MKNLTSKRRDILVGLGILIVIAGVIYLVRSKAKPLSVPDTSNEPTITQIEQNLKDKFNFNVPGGIEKTELRDVSGGDGLGIATRTEVLADLVDPDPGYFYQAWLENGDKRVSLGKMSMEKGGWLITYNSTNYQNFNKVVVSLEKVFDSNLEKRILEGSF